MTNRDGIERRLQLRRDDERGPERRAEERRGADRYPMAPEPTPAQWAMRERFLELNRSIQKTAHEFGVERIEVIRAVMAVRDWLLDSGWSAEYALARRTGFGEADARMRADMVASYNTRKRRATE